MQKLIEGLRIYLNWLMMTFETICIFSRLLIMLINPFGQVNTLRAKINDRGRKDTTDLGIHIYRNVRISRLGVNQRSGAFYEVRLNAPFHYSLLFGNHLLHF